MSEKLIKAIKSDWHSREAYSNKIQQTTDVTIITEDGTPYEATVTFTISWETIKKILALISKRAGVWEIKT